MAATRSGHLNATKYFLTPGNPNDPETCGEPLPYQPEPKNTPIFVGGTTQEICGCSTTSGTGVGGTVGVLNGEFKFPLQAVVQPARGPNFEFNITYRSISPHATSHDLLGPARDYAYAAHLTGSNQTDIMRHDGDGRADEYKRTLINPKSANESSTQPMGQSPATESAHGSNEVANDLRVQVEPKCLMQIGPDGDWSTVRFGVVNAVQWESGVAPCPQ